MPDLRWVAIAAAAACLLVCVAPARAYPAWWRQQAACIHRHESVDWHATRTWDGRPSWQHGGMQIDVRTWAAFAPRSFPPDPAAASRAQQLLVAWRIWQANGRRFGGNQWPATARRCAVP